MLNTIFRFILVLVFIVGLTSQSSGTEHLQLDFSIPYTTRLSPNAVIVPFRSLDRLIMLQARIDGVNGNFILDTGANGLVLNAKYFDADELMANTFAYGVSGAIKQLGNRQTDTLEVDELYFAGVKAQVVDLDQIEQQKQTRILGLIGFDLLQDYEIMFQYREQFLTFSRVDAEGNVLDPLPHTLDKQDSLSFVLGGHIPVIEVKVGEEVKRMGIDTGAEYNLLNKKSCRDVLKYFQVLKKIKITGASKRSLNVLAGKLSRVTLKDRYPCGSMFTLLVNFNQINTIYRMKLDGILGYQFLAPWIFSVNYRKEQLFLHKLKFNKP